MCAAPREILRRRTQLRPFIPLSRSGFFQDCVAHWASLKKISGRDCLADPLMWRHWAVLSGDINWALLLSRREENQDWVAHLVISNIISMCSGLTCVHVRVCECASALQHTVAKNRLVKALTVVVSPEQAHLWLIWINERSPLPPALSCCSLSNVSWCPSHQFVVNRCFLKRSASSIIDSHCRAHTAQQYRARHIQCVCACSHVLAWGKGMVGAHHRGLHQTKRPFEPVSAFFYTELICRLVMEIC